MSAIVEQLTRQLNFNPTKGQAELFKLLGEFILDKQTTKNTFVIKGYAGTGKTTVVGALVKILKLYGYKSLLMAPTGRAAKVASVYTKRLAFTIHKVIYQQKEDSSSGKIFFTRKKNSYKDTIFIVDEASMINEDGGFGKNGLLTELINYVFEDKTSGNKLILIGDNAQLPPVGQANSPALDIEYLTYDCKINVKYYQLTEVVRQAQKSGILENATMLRDKIVNQDLKIAFFTRQFKDIYKMTGEKMEDGLRYAYKKFGEENTIVVCRSNKVATQYNQFIRRTIRFSENELDAGDYLMIVKNNYFWLPEDSEAGFLANGDFVRVKRINKSDEEIYGFRFADVQLELIDYPNHPPIDAKIHLKALNSFAPSLEDDEMRLLYDNVLKEYAEEPNPAERAKLMRADPHLNALQVKFAYALTCHKSQGGQWEAVFVEQGYLTPEMINVEFLRWLYTAITRATKELYLVNFKPDFFNE